MIAGPVTNVPTPPGELEDPASWETVLDRLEADLAVGTRIHSVAAEGDEELPRLPAWQEPTGLGPVPAALAARARELHARQLQLQVQLHAAAEEARRRRDAGVQAPGGTYAGGTSPAAYLDLQA